MINLNFPSWTTLFWAAIAVAVVNFVLTALYVTFVQPWLSAIGRTQEQLARPKGKPSPMSFVVSLAAQGVTFSILILLITCLGIRTIAGGMALGLLVWLVIVATSIVVNHGFRGARTLPTVMDAGDWLTVLIAQGAVIGALVT